MLFFSKYKSNEALLRLELFAWIASGRRISYGLAVVFLSTAVAQSDSEAHDAFSQPVSLTPQRVNVFALL